MTANIRRNPPQPVIRHAPARDPQKARNDKMVSTNMYMDKQTNTQTYKQQNGKQKHVNPLIKWYTHRHAHKQAFI